ncbi:MAG: molybdopterin-synthase adenylyltransferase MoeB [Longimicrobiales bacterium]
MSIIRLPGVLRSLAANADEIEIEATTVAAVLAELVTRYPRLRRHLFDEHDQLRGYVNVYLNAEDMRFLQGEQTRVCSQDVITIVPSVAGGSSDTQAALSATLTVPELGRYSRHLALGEVGEEGQRKLKAARVLIVGAGGLGSPVGLYLAAAGVGHITVIDYDTVDVSNLQRQVLFRTDHVGQSKAEVAVRELRRLNPEITVEPVTAALTSANALDIMASYDVVVDGTDNFPTRYLVNDACALLGKPYVYGSILRFDGQVAVFHAQRGPCYRCLFREPPPPGLVPNCAEAGVLGALPGIIGSIQALETIKTILNRPDTLIGRLILFDALGFRWRELQLRKNPECPLCGDHPTITGLIDYEEFCGVPHVQPMANEIPEITPGELKDRLDAQDPITLIDVREPFEWEIANLETHGARLIPLASFAEAASTLNPADEIVVYCRSGSRSAAAVKFLRETGFPRVWNLQGGIRAWSQQIEPSLPTY